MAHEMETAQEKNSNITFKMYIDVLDRISCGTILSTRGISASEQRVCSELIRSGLVSNDAKEVFGRIRSTGELVITPEGISALDSWRFTIKQSSWSYKLGDTFLRFLWVIVGAVAASLPGILNCYNP